MLTSRFTAIAVACVSLWIAFVAAPPALAKHFNILMIGNSTCAWSLLEGRDDGYT